MPLYLFHQNMQRFAGTSAEKNGAYAGLPVSAPLPDSWPTPPPAAYAYGFANIAAHHPPAVCAPGGPAVPPIGVIGFTEVMNASHTPPVLALLAASLASGPCWGVTLFCGGTALAYREWISVFVARWITVEAVGRIALNPPYPLSSEAWPPNAAHGFQDWSADYRMLLYVVIRLPDHTRYPPLSDPLAIGFVHNVHTGPGPDQRAAFMAKLPDMANAMRKNAVAPRATHVYVGGDFNVKPQPRGLQYKRLHPYSAVTGPGTPLVFGTPAAMPILGGTTWGGQRYDHWYSDLDPGGNQPVVPGGIGAPVPSISTATWDGPGGLMSDHVATLLRIV